MVSNVQQDDAEREPFFWDQSGWETTFVENMRMLRERRGVSQTEFARRANERGLSFHQPTVQRIERGERPLKLTESLVIAELLGSTIEQMMNDVSLPFAYSMLERSASWHEVEVEFERLRSSRDLKHRIAVITENLEDYQAAASRFEDEARQDVVDRAVLVRERLQWAQDALDAAMASAEDVAAELAELPPLPAAAHGGTPWDDDDG